MIGTADVFLSAHSVEAPWRMAAVGALGERARVCAATVSAACRALALPRSTWYRWRYRWRRQHRCLAGVSIERPTDVCDDIDLNDMDLRDHIQRIAVKHSVYGYRRITADLRRQNPRILANHKRVLRIMREDNLLCLRTQRFVVTTDSEHGHPLYPNLAKDFVPTGLNQLWVADITYIRLQGEFIYLAVILDAFSRRVIGWALSRRIDGTLTANALRMALQLRCPEPGVIHHSDRGVQYASTDYTALLKGAGANISMSRRGNPYDNALAESFMKTLKYEEVYLSEYTSLAHAQACIAHFLEQVYNQERLHSRLGYVPPTEFEAMQHTIPVTVG